jgi:hypothetical protein
MEATLKNSVPIAQKTQRIHTVTILSDYRRGLD